MISVHAPQDRPSGVSFDIHCGGEHHRVTVSSPTAGVTLTGDLMLAVALLPAMARGEDLHIDHPVSPRLLAGQAQLQGMLATWWPEDLRPVRVTAAGRDQSGQRRDEVVGLAGEPVATLDLFTDPAVRIDRVLVVGGGPARLPARSTVATATVEMQCDPILRAAAVPEPLHEVVRAVGAAHALAPCRTLAVAEPVGARDLYPRAWHPLALPAWSGDHMQVVLHRPADDRVARLRRLAGRRRVLRRLRPCRSARRRPCGMCRPCRETALLLRASGNDGAAPALSFDPDAVAALPADGPAALTVLAQALRAAQAAGDEPLIAALEARLRAVGPDDPEWPPGWMRSLPLLGTDR